MGNKNKNKITFMDPLTKSKYEAVRDIYSLYKIQMRQRFHRYYRKNSYWNGIFKPIRKET